jgi:hypothetical protein
MSVYSLFSQKQGIDGQLIHKKRREAVGISPLFLQYLHTNSFMALPPATIMHAAYPISEHKLGLT